MKQNLISQLFCEVKESKALKFDLWQECHYTKQIPFDEGSEKRAFKTKNIPVYEVSDIGEAVKDGVEKIFNEKLVHKERGSGWTLPSVNHLQLHINKWNPPLPIISSCIDLPTTIKKKQACSNKLT
ncbi:hypothetical protein PR048_013719 [Dryococelus australis]|uniref:Uncharacterized protein n=1 Tax=Dryococelus australis TaxID=614101 RepID=A0ABQ9HSZ7_9NEOP|nr:hypothetical protein PR048_013719 [Dryococelus australis]